MTVFGIANVDSAFISPLIRGSPDLLLAEIPIGAVWVNIGRKGGLLGVGRIIPA